MTSSARPPERGGALRVAVFAKAPVPGTVKTRLAARLGAAAAAQLHAALVRHALTVALESGLGPVELWCAPDERHDFFAECAWRFGARLRAQRGRDLGERMRDAFAAAHGEGDALLLVGSDCPAMTPGVLRAAAEALAANDAVLGPAEDGGYVLIGLARDCAPIFEGVDWGSGAVLAQTRERLRGAGASWRELAPLWDVDRPEDYDRLVREGWLQGAVS